MERFLGTHVRVSLDVVRTRHRERRLFETCIETGTDVVIDNTNVTRDDRRRYVEPARAAGCDVHGYFFRSRVGECLERNAGRTGAARVPKPALLGTSARLELPSRDEGFDRLWFVSIAEDGSFDVQEWADAV